jgi:hypothetical protein
MATSDSIYYVNMELQTSVKCMKSLQIQAIKEVLQGNEV